MRGGSSSSILKLGTVPELISAIKSAASRRDLEAGRLVHRAAISSGQQSNVYVATSLISMYSKCGCLDDARAAFAAIPSPTTVPCNALLSAFVAAGRWHHALATFASIAAPTARSFCAAIAACSGLAESGDSAEALHRGAALHSAARAAGCIDPYTATALISMYAKCGCLDEARAVFQQQPSPLDTSSWNALLLGYAASPSTAHAAQAIELFETGERSGEMQPDARTFVAPIMACATLALGEQGRVIEGRTVKPLSLGKGKQFHWRVLHSGLCDLFVCSTLIDMYSKCGNMREAATVFHGMPWRRDVTAWTAVITGFAGNTMPRAALRHFERYCRDENETPNARTYCAALSAAGQLAELQLGKRLLHGGLCRAGLESHRAVAASLVDFYGRCGDCMPLAELALGAVAERDVVAWNALLAGYARRGEVARVFQLVAELREGGMQPDAATYVVLMASCSHAGLVERGRAVFAEIERPGVEHCHCMVDLLSRGNRVGEAAEMVMTRMPGGATAMAWKSVLAGCRATGDLEVAKLAFEQLVSLDGELGAAYVLMANVYGNAGMLQQRDELLLRAEEGKKSALVVGKQDEDEDFG